MDRDQVQPNEVAGDYMKRRYDEALATLTADMGKVGRELDSFLRIYLITFYHHGVRTGIESLYTNQQIANEAMNTEIPATA